MRRLLLNAIPTPTAYVQEHLTTNEKLALAHSPYQSTAALFADCMVACIDAVLRDSASELVFDRAGFERVRDAVSSTILDRLFETVGVVATVLTKARDADKAIRDATSLTLLAPLGDARAQLDALVHPGFVSRTGLARLRRIPVYLDGIIHRLGKLTEAGAGSNRGRDRVWQNEVEEATARYVRAGGALPLAPDSPEHLVRARWMLEELRLSLFAQHLPTAESVSLQRITKVLATGWLSERYARSPCRRSLMPAVVLHGARRARDDARPRLARWCSATERPRRHEAAHQHAAARRRGHRADALAARRRRASGARRR